MPVQFCGGSASVPRGVVYPPVSLSGGGEVLNCSDLNGISVIVDDHGPPPTICAEHQPRL